MLYLCTCRLSDNVVFYRFTLPKKSTFGDNIVFSLQLQINDQRFEDAEEMEHDRDSDSGHH